MKIVGVAYTAPDALMLKLKQLGIARNKIKVCAKDERLDLISRKWKFVIFQCMSDLKRNHKMQFKGIVFVLDAAVVLSKYNIYALDYKPSSVLHEDGLIRVNNARLPKNIPDVDLTRNRFNLMESCIEEVTAFVSILGPLMTFIYSLPKSTHQDPIKCCVCGWFTTKGTVKDLEKKIKQLVASPISDKQFKRLADICSTEEANLYKKALSDKNKTSTELSSEYGVSEFELNYIRAISGGK